LIEDDFGDLPLAVLKYPRIRGEFKAWRDRFANTPRKADYAWSTLARILAFCKDRGLIAVNPYEGGGRLYHADRTEKLWQDPEVANFLDTAPPEMALALIRRSGQASGKATCPLRGKRRRRRAASSTDKSPRPAKGYRQMHPP
jgi:hypothetical protein